MEVVNKIHREKQFRDLSELFQYVMKPIIDIPWYDWFYDEWDTSGASDEIAESWARFLDKAEDFMESDEGEEERKGLTGGMTGGIVAHLVKAIQEQTEIINDLRARVAQLEGEN